MYIEPRSDEQILHEYKDDMFNKFEDHVACWELDHRGGVGETAIHLCVLHDNPVTMDIAKMLLRRYPKMALDYFEDDEYYGRFVCSLVIFAKVNNKVIDCVMPTSHLQFFQ